MLLTREQLEQLENALWREWSDGMAVRPKIEVKNHRTNYGAILSVDVMIDTEAMGDRTKNLHFSTTGLNNVLHDVGADMYGNIALFVNLTERLLFVRYFAHWMK